MKCIVVLWVFFSSFGGFSLFAQKGPCTEESIKANANKIPPQMDDIYLFNPVLEKPVVGQAEIKKAFAANAVNPEFTANHKNFKGEPAKIDRIVIAPSGEMAYVYGTDRISFDKQDGTHVDSPRAFLSVWRADGGACKLAASMIQRLAHQ